MTNQYLPGTIAMPSAMQITAITRSFPMVVTFSINPVTASNSYIPGQLVHLNVPRTYGMSQADGLTGRILVVGSTTIALNIDSQLFDSFVVPTGNVEQPATFTPAGSQNLQFSNETRFEPFQSLNDRGN